MATERLSMRQIREILRQKWTLGQTHRQVAAGLGVSLGTVSTVERRARAAGLAWADVDTLTDDVPVQDRRTRDLVPEEPESGDIDRVGERFRDDVHDVDLKEITRLRSLDRDWTGEWVDKVQIEGSA